MMRLLAALLILFFQLPCLGQRSGRRTNASIQVLYPEKILLPAKCVGDSIKIRIAIRTTSANPVTLFGFSMTQENCTLSINKKILTESDSLVLDSDHPLELRITFTVEKAGFEGPILYFSSDQLHYRLNKMNFEFGAYDVPFYKVRSGQPVVIDFPEYCADSIKIYFPYGGTSSGATLFPDSISKQSTKSLSYGIFEEGNYLWFSKKDIGKYYVRFGACHWSNNFWLTIKQKTAAPPECVSPFY